MLFLSLALSTAICGYYLSIWWLCCIPVGVFCYLLGKEKKAWHIFMISFLATSLVWFLMAIIMGETSQIVQRITTMFLLPNMYFVYAMTVVSIGIPAGISGLTGYYARQIFQE